MTGEQIDFWLGLAGAAVGGVAIVLAVLLAAGFTLVVIALIGWMTSGSH